MKPDLFHTQLIRASVIVALILFMETPAAAYIDPGSGSMLMQLVIGGAMAGLVLFRSGLRRAVDWFRRSAGPDRRRE